jgi:Cu(I)/Ag(I) efflux system membrane fusion protein
MKSTKIFFSLLCSFLVLAMMNCSGKKDNAHDVPESNNSATHASDSSAPETASNPHFSTDPVFQQQLGDLFKSYVSLKDAFVASDAAKTKSAAESTSGTLGKVDMKLLSGAAHNDWMTYLAGIQSSLKEIIASTDIEVQRKAFSTLSGNLYKSIKAFGIGGATAYYEFCPMAFDNQGAYWLSQESKIRNPYFGDKMLTCGVVKETLK